jgi:hypothetical protein
MFKKHSVKIGIASVFTLVVSFVWANSCYTENKYKEMTAKIAENPNITLISQSYENSFTNSTAEALFEFNAGDLSDKLIQVTLKSRIKSHFLSSNVDSKLTFDNETRLKLVRLFEKVPVITAHAELELLSDSKVTISTTEGVLRPTGLSAEKPNIGAFEVTLSNLADLNSIDINIAAEGGMFYSEGERFEIGKSVFNSAKSSKGIISNFKLDSFTFGNNLKIEGKAVSLNAVIDYSETGQISSNLGFEFKNLTVGSEKLKGSSLEASVSGLDLKEFDIFITKFITATNSTT